MQLEFNTILAKAKMLLKGKMGLFATAKKKTFLKKS